MNANLYYYNQQLDNKDVEENFQYIMKLEMFNMIERCGKREGKKQERERERKRERAVYNEAFRF